MSPDAQRIAISQACGWKQIHPVPFWGGIPPWTTVGADSQPLPDYLGSLDAMHSVIRSLTVDKVQKIAEQLVYSHPRNYELSAIGCVLLATPAQLAESFLRALNLWDESK